MLLLSSSDSVEKGLEDLNLALEKINRFLIYIGLELSPSKTKLCVFSYGLRKTQNIGILFKDSFILNVSTIKFLGMKLTSTLNWSLHIQNIWNICQNPLKIIKCPKYTWWDADPRVLINLYTALIRSRIEYGGFFFTIYLKALHLN